MITKIIKYINITIADVRGHFRTLIKGVRNTHGTGLIVGNDGNC